VNGELTASLGSESSGNFSFDLGANLWGDIHCGQARDCPGPLEVQLFSQYAGSVPSIATSDFCQPSPLEGSFGNIWKSL
jgi:hypothetical protein